MQAMEKKNFLPFWIKSLLLPAQPISPSLWVGGFWEKKEVTGKNPTYFLGGGGGSVDFSWGLRPAALKKKTIFLGK